MVIMDISRRLSIALLITAVVLSVQANETEDDTCVWVGVEVNLDHGRNSSKAEYIGEFGDVIRRLNDVEDLMRDIKKTIVAMDNKISTIDNSVSVTNNTTTTANGSSIDNNVSAVNIPKMELLHWQIFRERLVVCTDITKEIDHDTVTKCMTMQTGVRNGRSVSVHTWVIQDYDNKVENQRGDHYSQPFYHTVPGYKFRLRGHIYSDSDIFIWPQLLPGEYDDQLKWPLSQKANMTVLTNTGLEAHYKTFSGDQSTCLLNRPTSRVHFQCDSFDAKWGDVWRNKKHILTDGSVVVKLYFYN